MWLKSPDNNGQYIINIQDLIHKFYILRDILSMTLMMYFTNTHQDIWHNTFCLKRKDNNWFSTQYINFN